MFIQRNDILSPCQYCGKLERRYHQKLLQLVFEK